MDLDYSARCLAVCSDAFVSQSCVLTEGGQVDVFENVKTIMDSALHRFWKYFLLKVSILRREFLVEGGFERLESLLQAWLALRTAMNKGCESSVDIATFRG